LFYIKERSGYDDSKVYVNGWLLEHALVNFDGRWGHDFAAAPLSRVTQGCELVLFAQMYPDVGWQYLLCFMCRVGALMISGKRTCQ